MIGLERLPELDRRTLLQLAGAAGLSGFLGDLAGVGTSAADAATGNDYKALVCIFLFGGNDGLNLLVPTETSAYADYSAARGNLAVPKGQLIPATSSLGLHPSLQALHPAWAAGHVAPVLNVGTLLAPTTKADAKAGRNLPASLYSHSDQQVENVLGAADRGMDGGWAGRLSELLVAPSTSGLSMNISLAGSNALQAGRHSSAYTLGGGGPVTFNARSDRRRAAVMDAMWSSAAAGNDPFAAQLGRSLAGSRDLAAHISSILAKAPKLTTQFPKSGLGSQLGAIARLISVRQQLGVRRQIFFVAMGGFDTHTNQLAAQPKLFADLAQSMAALHAATTELGVGSGVTAFTQSEFGRTLTSNGQGSDHAWGSHQLVVGGAVHGGKAYGSMPDLALGTPLEVGGGRFIPTTPSDAYSATLASWFGAPKADLAQVFPHLSRFDHQDLGFLAKPKAAKKKAKKKHTAHH